MNKSFSVVLPAVGAALLTVLSPIIFTIGPVPITFQTFAVGLIAVLFKRRDAVLAVALYLTLGALGLPVFAGGSGGFQALFSPTGGYLWGCLLFALTTSSLTDSTSSYIRIFFASLLGDTLVFAGGILSLHFLGNMPLTQAAAVGITPFLLPDFLKLILITVISPLIFRSLKDQAYFR